MDMSNEIGKIIGQPENSSLEYKAVLPPSKNIAQLISAFANTNGGYIVLGVSQQPDGVIDVIGLTQVCGLIFEKAGIPVYSGGV